MSVFYFAITNSKYIVCKHGFSNHNYDNVINNYVSREPPEQEIFFLQNNLTFHCITIPGLSFIAVTDQNVSRQHARNFVIEVSKHFSEDAARIEKAKTGNEKCLQYSYGPSLQKKMENFSSYQPNPHFDQLKQNVDKVTSVMHANAQQALQMNDKLSDLVKDTSDLEMKADTFKNASVKVSRKAKWENLRMKIIIGVCVGTLIAIILLVILWQTGAFGKH